MRKLRNGMLIASFGIAALAAVPAAAAITVTSDPGSNPYAGPTPTFEFDAPTPEWSGTIRTDSPGGVAAQPFGSTGGYATVGPTDGTPGILSLSAFADIDWISFIWGSIDTYNKLEIFSAANVLLGTINGSDVAAPANGNQTDPDKNRLVKITFTGSDRSAVDYLKFSSTSNAFEFDKVAVGAVPEPGTWMLMLLGFGAIGFAMRSRAKTKVRFQFA